MKKTVQLPVRMDVKLHKRLKRQSRKRARIPLAQLLREYADEVLLRLEQEQKAAKMKKPKHHSTKT